MSTVRKIVIFVGPPGAGKGTLSSLCVEQLNWVQLSTGNLCRKHIAEKTEIGQKIDAAIRSGELVADHLISSMVDQWLVEQQAQHTILDGYPRTVVQAEALKNLLTTKLNSVEVVVVRLSISEEKVVARLSGRMVCSNKDCQAVYSTIKGSAFEPKNVSACNKCSKELVRRVDDEPTAIKDRLKTYYKHEKHLLDYYEGAGLRVKDLSVERSLDQIFNELKSIMEVDS